jgi:putative DNA primase/helicase
VSAVNEFVRVLDKNDPRDIAHIIVNEEFTSEDGIRTLHYFQEEFYAYDGCAYRRAHKDEVRAAIWEVLRDAEAWVKDPAGPGMVLAPFKPRSRNVDEVYDALKAECELTSAEGTPFWLPGSPRHAAGIAAAELLPVANGLVHVSSGRLYPATPALFVESASGVAFDQEALPPKQWKKFLNQILDAAAQRTLQTIFGCCLVRDTSFQKIFLLIGPKRSGKGTIAYVLQQMLGKESIASMSLTNFSQQFGLQKLIGKPLCIVPDARFGKKNDPAPLAERMLSISGEDVINIARKFREDWVGRLPTRFLILTNELPRLEDASGALADRFVILKTKQSFLGKEDLDLRSRLIAELPGILNWAVAGYQRLQREKRFVEPSSSVAEKEMMRTVMSPITSFIEDRCELGSGFQVQKKELYAAYVNWCDANGVRQETSHVFGRDLLAAYPSITTTRPAAADRIRCYTGIALKDPPASPDRAQNPRLPLFGVRAKSAV